MVLQERIELSTSPLPRECSTTELLQRRFTAKYSPANGAEIAAFDARRKGQWTGFCRAAGLTTNGACHNTGSSPVTRLILTSTAIWTPRRACAMGGAMRNPSDPPPQDRPSTPPAKQRQDRRKLALKANMARRKAQAKARTQDQAPSGETDRNG